MREHRLVLEGSFCDTNLFPDGVQTVAEAKKLGRSLCPNLEKCRGAFMDTHLCAMRFGLEVARHVLEDKSTVEQEMVDFRREHQNPPGGWAYSIDRKEIKIIPESEGAMQLVEQFARVALGEKIKLLDPLAQQVGKPKTAEWVAVNYHPYAGMIIQCSACEGKIKHNDGDNPEHCPKCGIEMANVHDVPKRWGHVLDHWDDALNVQPWF